MMPKTALMVLSLLPLLLMMPAVFASVPTITLYSPQNQTYNTTEVILNVSTDMISTVMYQLNDGSLSMAFNNNFNGSINLGTVSGTNKPIQGSNRLFVSVENGTDKANTTIYFSVDTVPPSINLRSPQDSLTTDSPFNTFEFVPTDSTTSVMECYLYMDNGQRAGGPINVVNGTKGMVNAAIPAGSHQWSIRCKDAFGNIGIASRNITVGTKCGIDVSELTGKGNLISMILKNTGSVEEEVDYSIKVDLNETAKGYVKLGVGDVKEVLHNFTFKVGNYLLESTAKSSCGAQDYISAGYAKIPGPSPCTNPAGQHGDYRQDINALKIYRCDNGFWTLIASGTVPYCESVDINHCGDGIVNCDETRDSCPQDYNASAISVNIGGVPTKISCRCADEQVAVGSKNGTIQEFYDYCKTICDLECAFDYDCQTNHICSDFRCVAKLSKCGIDIQDFDYTKQLAIGEMGKVFANIKNTGETREKITVNFTAGIKAIGSAVIDLNPGADKLVNFEYGLGVGSHNIVLQALANCGASDREDATVSVRNVSITSLPESILATEISLYKDKIETTAGAERPIQLNIKTTKPQLLNIKVAGVPSNWLSYPSIIGVTEDRHINIFVKPDAEGEFNVTIFVEGEEQNFTSTAFLKVMTVAEKISVSQQTIIILIVSVVILFSIAFFLATRHLHLQE